ncbi:hypothetical protein OG562_12375 [Streptomyces sp. NBC_01275]|uniref:hypothetical protein n=1 Tax=Streptomyces sp. NBC_01275 TaxID=2903807 RepID=UPI0022597456|nr:hypothetical protein [Streptomyces sp. NBC_01275]MCX4761756.1 hypothetical protein [Streptomyces sp. NBC_01275]
MRARVRALLVGGAAALALPAAPARAASSAGALAVGAGETYVLSATTRLTSLSLAEGGTLAVPDGYSLTMTVDGVETGSVLTATLATGTTIAPGAYQGDIVLTVAEQHTATFANVTFPIRQALYVGASGVVAARSVLSAVTGGRVTDSGAQSVGIVSTGEAFDGVYVADGGAYTLRRSRIAFTGNGRCDFVGDGAAVVATGPGTTLLLDGVTIANQGVVRSAVVAEDGCSLVVKNSRIRCLNGVLPADYVPAGGANMLVVPWRLGISGNVRATNLLGANTTATYLSSSIESETWGAFSVDSTSDSRATVVNCRIANLGDEGYGTFADGNVVERILGCEIDAGTYATIIGASNATVHYGDSTEEAVAALDAELGLGLSDAELAALPVRGTSIASRGFGVLWHGAGTLRIDGSTVLDTAHTAFLDKAVRATITVDGSQGARITPGNGVVLQVMETDNPGSVNGVYTEPVGDPVRDDGFDVTAVHSADTTAAFTSISVQGDFYNARRSGQNMALTFDRSSVEGVLSASVSRHAVDSIGSAQYTELGHVANTVRPVVNNGVLVTLTGGSTWTVTGTSYLSVLALDADCAVTAPAGGTAAMTVDGETTALTPGQTHTGAITLTVA